MAEWPRNWDELVDGSACEMCLADRDDDPFEAFRIARTRLVDAYLNSRAIQHGYTFVIWRGPHVVEWVDLPSADAAEYWRDVARVAGALRTYYSPLKLNYVTLGNSEPHLHTHVVPRYVEDPNAGGPFPIVPDEDPGEIPGLAADVAALRALLA